MAPISFVPARNRHGRVVAVALVDADIAPELRRYRWSLNNYGYVVRTESLGRYDGKQRTRTHYLHRMVLGCAHGDGLLVDHISRDKLDCRRSNLRFVTPSESLANREGGPGHPRRQR